jgi:hypothetical protein
MIVNKVFKGIKFHHLILDKIARFFTKNHYFYTP